MLISFIIPCYKSELSIALVVDEIVSTMSNHMEYNYEIILVNDYSPDNVFDVIKRICRNDSHIKAISLAKNFGQQAALMAGMRSCKGDVAVCMDDDGQNPASEIWKMIAILDNECDVVFAKYIKKQHSLFKKLGSKVNALMAKVLIGKPKDLYLSSFFVCKKYIVDEIVRYVSAYPYIAGLILRSCGKIKNVTVEHRIRVAGSSTYTIKKMVALWLNGFTAFSVKPLRIASVIGFMLALTGFLYGAYIIINKLLNPWIPMGYSSMMSAIVFIGGMVMLILGLLGEYIGRIYISINNAPQYVIREYIDFNDEHDKP